MNFLQKAVAALPAPKITNMAYGKIPKVQIHEEKSNFQEKYFSTLLWEANELLHTNLAVYFYSAVLQALLADRIINFDIMWKWKILSTHSTQLWAAKWYIIVRTSANVNLTQLDQNIYEGFSLEGFWCLVVFNMIFIVINLDIIKCDPGCPRTFHEKKKRIIGQFFDEI